MLGFVYFIQVHRVEDSNVGFRSTMLSMFSMRR